MIKNRLLVLSTITIITLIIIIAVIIIYTYYYAPVSQKTITTSMHNFQVKKIYPTKKGGREWFFNMNDPTGDKIFDPGSKITRQYDGSWQIEGRDKIGYNEDQVRMNVNTPHGEPQWKNVEITGYAKVVSASSPHESLTWYARGGRHSDSTPCQGTSLKGSIRIDGTVFWQKEIWHTGGYTDERAKATATTNLLFGRWIGWKVVMYNINNNTAVKMESYLDNGNNNEWKKVTELVDDGDWYAKSSDREFYSVGCGRPKDYIVTNAGPVVAFRSDNMKWDFTDLSVREINASSIPPK